MSNGAGNRAAVERARRLLSTAVIALVVLVVLTTPAVAAHANPARPPTTGELRKALDRAEDSQADRDYASVLEVLAPYRELADPEVDFALAYAHMSTGIDGRKPDEIAHADMEEALRLGERAAARNHGPALNLLYMIHGNGWGVPANLPKALGYLERAAAAGDVGARANLAAQLYLGAQGLPRDVGRACQLFVGLLRDDGAAMIAAYYLGMATLRGQCGLGPDDREAARLIRRAAKAGVREAERDYGSMLQHGMGVKADPVAAADWFEKAADHGDGRAHWLLGIAYVEGNGRPVDPVRAVGHFRKSAQAGSTDGMVSLAVMHATGSGVPQDYGKALALYQQAAEAGSAHAYRNLALMHAAGQGTPVDFSQAWLSYSKGIALGDPVDDALAALIEVGLDDAQRTRAEREFAAWHAQRANGSAR